MKKILIVDDSLIIRMSLKQLLSENNYEIQEATNGKEAIEKLQSFQPDLVTLDITMPEMDGVTALKKIKQMSPDTIVIMCSAMGQTKSIVQTLEFGAKDFIIKPFQKDQVLSTIQKYM